MPFHSDRSLFSNRSLLSRCSRTARMTVPIAMGILAAVSNCVWAADDPIDFNSQIRPILSNNCFACHGPEEAHREGGFRLDSRDSAFGEADSGAHPIVAGDPAKSELIARIMSTDESLVMPPPESNKSLKPEEIDALRKWIEQGATWDEHWSLVPPTRPAVPATPNSGWVRNEIDSFVIDRLTRQDLKPQSDADRETLIRRVTFDLTGLPPTLDEIDAFLADESDEAYERLVDRLLDSPRYGEHMARFWLDAARYGDTHGLHLDNYREIWPYRDWVVKAFNDNLPYDQFVIEQLAGDLLPEPTRDQLIATGFNRCNVTTSEGGSIQEEVYVRNVVDRVVTTSTVFMGLTMECSRCHDHKFDPLTMRDFYSLFAYFNSIDGNPLDGNRKDHAPVMRVPTTEQESRLQELDTEIAAVQQQLNGPWKELDELQTAWVNELTAPSESGSESDSSMRLSLGDWYSVGPFADTQNYLFNRKHGPEGKAVQLDAEFTLSTGDKVRWVKHPEWVDGKPHTGLPGEIAANFLTRTIHSPEARKVSASFGSDDALKVYLNGKQILAANVSRGVAADQNIVELPLRKGDNELLLKVINHGGATGFYFALKSEETSIPGDVLEIARLAADQRNEQQQAKLQEFFRTKVATFEPLEDARKKLAQLQASRADVDRQVATTLIWKELADPREAFMLKRGEYDQKGEKVARRTPAALPPMAEHLPNNRLGFAQWLVTPGHPLTSRVQVNRLWQQLFGTGLVKTTEDFGSQGEPPSHPQLLDWLAVQFVEEGWDMKKTMKRLVMSSSYRQSSHVTPDRLEKDPANRLLSRGPRYRLDAEMLRDQALFLSGLLVEKQGGPSVKPPQPDGLWFAVGYSGSNTVRFVADQGPDKVHRRTLYTFIKRTSPPPQMSTFDGPSRESCVVRRERTNTPMQALLLLNDPQYVEAARNLAQRTLREGGSERAQQAAWLFRACTGRHASEQELKDLVQAVEEELKYYEQHEEAAKQLIAVGSKSDQAPEQPAAVAAWTIVSNMVLNLDEVLTKN